MNKATMHFKFTIRQTIRNILGIEARGMKKADALLMDEADRLWTIGIENGKRDDAEILEAATPALTAIGNLIRESARKVRLSERPDLVLLGLRETLAEQIALWSPKVETDDAWRHVDCFGNFRK